MKETKLISKEFSSEGTTEILDIADVKEHLYIDSGNTDFDSRLGNLITETRQYLEEITGLSLIDRVVTIWVYYESSFGIPFGPVTTFDSANRKTGINTYEVLVNNDDYEIEGNDFKLHVGFGKIKLIYEVGHTDLTLPAGLKLAWLNEIAKRFEHRGDREISDTNDLVKPYKDLEWLV